MSDQVGVFDFNKQPGGYTKKNYFKIKEGEKKLFRILPPFKSGIRSNTIAKYWSIFWLKNTAGKSVPIASIQVKRDKQIIVRDPLVEVSQQLKNQVDILKQNGESPQVIKLAEEKAYSLNPDTNYYLNVISPTGEIGSLALRYTAYQLLDKKLKELSKMGIDAINAGPNNGVFFVFERYKDEKGKTVYTVDVAQKVTKDPVTGRVSSDYMMAPIGQEELKRMESEAFDLLSMYKIYTPEEMAALATLDPRMVDQVTKRPTQVEETVEEESESEELDTSFSAAYNEFSSAPAPAYQQPVQQYAPPAPVYQQPAPTYQQPAPAQRQQKPAPQRSTAPMSQEDMKKIIF